MRKLALGTAFTSVSAWLVVLILSSVRSARRVSTGFEESLFSEPVIASVLGVLISSAVAVVFFRMRQYILAASLSAMSTFLAVFALLSASAAAGG